MPIKKTYRCDLKGCSISVEHHNVDLTVSIPPTWVAVSIKVTRGLDKAMYDAGIRFNTDYQYVFCPEHGNLYLDMMALALLRDREVFIPARVEVKP